MKVKAICFEMLSENCKYKDETTGCSEEDNFSAVCDNSECPIWNDLVNSEVEM